jgi:hypothetical protein
MVVVSKMGKVSMLYWSQTGHTAPTYVLLCHRSPNTAGASRIVTLPMIVEENWHRYVLLVARWDIEPVLPLRHLCRATSELDDPQEHKENPPQLGEDPGR